MKEWIKAIIVICGSAYIVWIHKHSENEWIKLTSSIILSFFVGYGVTSLWNDIRKLREKR